MIPEHFHMTELGIMTYVFIYLPVVIIIILLLWKKLKLSLVLLVPIALIVLTLPFWDVYMIGRDADQLCKEQGGLHVYKTVEADGFFGGGGEKYWLKYGFNYIERGKGKFMGRYTMQDGKVQHEYVTEFLSRYGIGSGDNHKAITKRISRTSQTIVNRESNEVLSEWIRFHIHPGIFDGIFLRLVGSGPVVWHCGDKSKTNKNITYRDLVKVTINPLKRKGNTQ